LCLEPDSSQGGITKIECLASRTCLRALYVRKENSPTKAPKMRNAPAHELCIIRLALVSLLWSFSSLVRIERPLQCFLSRSFAYFHACVRELFFNQELLPPPRHVSFNQFSNVFWTASCSVFVQSSTPSRLPPHTLPHAPSPHSECHCVMRFMNAPLRSGLHVACFEINSRRNALANPAGHISRLTFLLPLNSPFYVAFVIERNALLTCFFVCFCVCSFSGILSQRALRQTDLARTNGSSDCRGATRSAAMVR